MTKTFLAPAARAMNSPIPVPWVLSPGRIRCQYVQPFSASVWLVADAEMLGILPSSRIGPTCCDSPENAGPTRPTILSVLIACWASAVACSGAAWLS